MKKNKLLMTVVCFLFAFNANAAEVKNYVSVKFGASFLDVKADGQKEDFSHLLTDAAYGVKINETWRAELAVAYRAESDKTETVRGSSYWEREKDTVSGWTFGVNGYYDIQTGTKVIPYVGAGIGMAKMKYDIDWKAGDGVYDYFLDESFSKVSFAWNVGAGVSYKADDRFALDFGYRYSDFGSFTKGGVKFSSHANEVMLGARYFF